MPLTLESPIAQIDPRLAARTAGRRRKGVEPAKADEVLASAFDITTVGGLLHHYPRRYIDRSRVQTIRELKIGGFVTVIARVRKVAKRQTRNRQTMVTVTIGDGTGYLDLTFFNQPWLASQYQEGQELAVSGLATLYRGRLQLSNQEVEFLGGDDADLVHTGRITPVHQAVGGHHHPDDPRADPPRARAAAHAPRSDGRRAEAGGIDRGLRPRDSRHPFPRRRSGAGAARERLKFDELFTLELGVAFRKHRVEAEQQGVAHRAGQRAHRPAAGDAPVRAHRRTAPGDGRGRRGHGAASPHERAAAGRRGSRQDPGGPARRAGGDRVRATRPRSWRPPRCWRASTSARWRRCWTGWGPSLTSICSPRARRRPPRDRCPCSTASPSPTGSRRHGCHRR